MTVFATVVALYILVLIIRLGTRLTGVVRIRIVRIVLVSGSERPFLRSFLFLALALVSLVPRI